MQPERMRQRIYWLAFLALANYAVTVWHAYLAAKVNPALPAADFARIAGISGALTLAGIVLLLTRLPKIGSVVLIAVFLIGLVIGSAEHFFVAGPNNIFDVINSDWTAPFKISVWSLLVVEIAGLVAAGCVLAAPRATA
jgi:hypothetical protein